MTLNLTGLLQDGSNLAPGVPGNPRTPLRTQVGGSAVVNVAVIRPSGAAVVLVAGYTAVLTVKRRPQDVPAAITLTGVLTPGLGPNVVQFTLASSATKLLQPGPYVYDVVLTDPAGNRDAVIPLSPFLLEPAVTPPQ